MAAERISFPLLRGSALCFGLLEVVLGFCQKSLWTIALWAHFMPLCSRLLTSPLTLHIWNINQFLWKHFRSDKNKIIISLSKCVCAEIYTPSHMQILEQTVMLVLMYLWQQIISKLVEQLSTKDVSIVVMITAEVVCELNRLLLMLTVFKSSSKRPFSSSSTKKCVWKWAIPFWWLQ